MRKRTLGRRYRLIEEIGSGGMGTVYRARDQRTGDIVAVKILHPHLTRDAEYLERFRREIEITRSLASPNIIRVLDFGEDGSDRFFVMEYVAGVSLHRMLRQSGALPLRQALDIATQVATALEEAHAKGVVHRDIKPENIVITPDGRVKVGDFGIARAQDHTRLTLTGAVMGTVQYMAPELLTGGGDARSDIYSLGVILYQMLVGAPPFEAPTPWEILRKHREEPVPSLDARGMPAAIVPILGECLAKEPENRYQDAASLRDDLAAQFGRLPGADGGAVAIADQQVGDLGGQKPPPGRRFASPLGPGNWGRMYAILIAAFIALAVPAAAAAALFWLDGGGSSPVSVRATTSPTVCASPCPAPTVTTRASSASATPMLPTASSSATATPTLPSPPPISGVGGQIYIGAPELMNGKIRVPVNATQATDPFSGFNIHLVFDGSLAAIVNPTNDATTGDAVTGDAFQSVPGSAMFCGHSVPGTGEFLLSCVNVGAFPNGTLGPGTLAYFWLTPQRATGCSRLHLFEFAALDGGDTTSGSFTINSAASTAQQNTYGTDVYVSVADGSACSVSAVAPSPTPVARSAASCTSPHISIVDLQPPIGTLVRTGDPVTITVDYCAVASNSISVGLCFTPDKGPQGNAINIFIVSVDQNVAAGSMGSTSLVWHEPDPPIQTLKPVLPRTLGGVLARLGVYGLDPPESEAKVGDYPGC